MRVYIAAVSGERQYVGSLLSLNGIVSRAGDKPEVHHASRGDRARSAHCGWFLDNKEYDAILLLDLDMKHPPDLLERLRSHNLDMVTAHYYRRVPNVRMSICSDLSVNNTWPYPPLLEVPASGLHEIACAGMGCVLIKREVVEAVEGRLPPGDNPFAIGTMPHVSKDHRAFGSDFRFFTLARELGYKLWLDASLESKHGTTYWVGRELAEKLATPEEHLPYLDDIIAARKELHGMDESTLKLRIAALLGQKTATQVKIKDILQKKAALHQQHEQLSANVLGIDAAMTELQTWLRKERGEEVPHLEFPETKEE